MFLVGEHKTLVCKRKVSQGNACASNLSFLGERKMFKCKQFLVEECKSWAVNAKLVGEMLSVKLCVKCDDSWGNAKLLPVCLLGKVLKSSGKLFTYYSISSFSWSHIIPLSSFAFSHKMPSFTGGVNRTFQLHFQLQFCNCSSSRDLSALTHWKWRWNLLSLMAKLNSASAAVQTSAYRGFSHSLCNYRPVWVASQSLFFSVLRLTSYAFTSVCYRRKS